MVGASSLDTIEILLVDDNPGDVRLTQEAFQQVGLNGCLNVVSDGVAALNYLRREGEFHNATRPHLILLDLNMPRKDGRQVLAEVKADPELRCIPVVVLTTSTADEDVRQVYDLHANCYIVKPLDLDKFIQVIRAIEEFWLTAVKFPVAT
jgi:CheY-like chemotaxis protein